MSAPLDLPDADGFYDESPLARAPWGAILTLLGVAVATALPLVGALILAG